jgi:1-acyl-sn-glycerol-3-phosphate acyltransferase
MGEEEKTEFKAIDIKEVINSKSPKVARLLPGFVYRYINRILHIEYINHVLKDFGRLHNLEFVAAIIKDFNVNPNISGLENLPVEGRYIFASNHPLGGFDGILLMDILGRRYKEIRFLVNDILLNLTPMKGLLIPINKHGAHSRDAAKLIEEEMESDKQILTFPAGLVSRKIKGKIVDLEWKKNFIQKAVEYKRDVIPVHFSGRNSNWFYFVANLRKFLRIKWNLEMFYLVDETYKHRNMIVYVDFGKPISWQTFDNSKNPREWADFVKAKVYSMESAGTKPDMTNH